MSRRIILNRLSRRKKSRATKSRLIDHPKSARAVRSRGPKYRSKSAANKKGNDGTHNPGPQIVKTMSCK